MPNDRRFLSPHAPRVSCGPLPRQFEEKYKELDPTRHAAEVDKVMQRGSNENTNVLLRQLFPKGIDMSKYSQTQLNAVARRLNERPGMTLDYEPPAERFSQLVASTS